MKCVISLSPGFWKTDVSLGLNTTIGSRTYNVFGVLTIERCISGNRLSKKEGTIAARSPNEPITNSLLSLKGVKMLLHDIDGAHADM